MAYTETALYVDSVAYAAVTPFAISTAYTVGQIRRQLAAPAAGNERCFVCIIAGTSAASEPAWVITKGAKTVSGTATFQECTTLPGLNGDSTNTPPWAASRGSIVIGVVIKNIAATHYFICTTAGTGGTGAEPTWNTTTGATTVDASVTWTCLGVVGSFTRWGAAAKLLQNPVWNGTSWLVNANMTIYIGDDHSESSVSTYTEASVCQVLCVDHTVALPAGVSDLRTTAAIALTSSNTWWNGIFNGYVYGLNVSVNQSAAFFNAAGLARVVYEQCTFSISVATANFRLYFGDGSNVGGTLEARNCTFNLAAVTQSIEIHGNLRLENCSLTGSFGGSANQIFSGNNTFVNLIAEGCDFASNVASGANLVGSHGGGAPLGYLQFKDCKIPPDLTSIYRGGAATMGTTVIELIRCDSGGTAYRNERHTADGVLTTSTTVVRTGGAVDGTTPISHQIATTANANNYARTFNALPLVTWNDVIGTSRNVTVYGLVNASRVPNNDEFWFDVEYLGSASSPDGDFKRGRALPLATGTALSTDTSTWNNLFSAIDGTALNVTLSNSNRTVTRNNTIAGGAVSSAFLVTGKYYYEETLMVWGGTWYIGILLSSGSVTDTTSSPNVVGFQPGSSQSLIYTGGVSTGKNLGITVVGDIFASAIDLTNRLAWFRRNNGNWNGDATANPATGVGGVTIPVGAFAPYVTGSAGTGSVDKIAFNFGQSAYNGTPPAGFNNWGNWLPFKQTLTLSSPVPQQKGYLYVYPKFGRASVTYYLDPKLELS